MEIAFLISKYHMASIISGYENDIFISYRQKDNKYDGWVTEFVDNLKRDLEATFKEEISVYFDINTQDGLLDTYDVKASLNGKLKCLVFIPIISQTYCDPKSFAWKNEFCVFNKLAREDQYGRDIKLRNGNVANAVKEIIRGLDQPPSAGSQYILAQTEGSSDKLQISVSEKSIAVLPFADMSPSHDQEYLGDGLAEELINILSQIKELKVTGRSSSFSFKNKNFDLTTIGKVLNVENILEGSIQKSKKKVRITAQLISAADGFHIWSQRYDREMDDIFALQDDICSNISEHLKIKLLENQETAKSKRPTRNSEAYEMFLKGDFYCKKYSEEGFERSIEYFKKAVELDPEYADAWWYLGFVNYEMHGWLNIQKERLETAIYCANKAIEIDETNAYGHFLLALIHFTYDYDWPKVESEIALGNKYAHSQFPAFSFSLEPWYRAMLYGDFNFAVHRLQKGVEHDPLNFYYQFHLAQIYLYGVRNYKKTLSVLEGILELGFPPKKAWRPLCLTYLFEEEFELAEEYARKDYDASGGKGHGAAHLIMCLAASGKTGAADQLYQLVKEKLSVSEFPYFLHAKANIYLDNMEDAFSYLDKAVTEKNYWLFALKYSPEWDMLRSDPRFDKVLERMNFPK